jgi:pyruvate/2-oxoglutarate dehydrogenase complex dihydrolipoamide acyltransferase (E2) component
MSSFKRSRKLSSWRSISLHAWGKPRDPTVYGNLEIDASHALEYVRAQSDASGAKVTLTHLVGKAIADAIATRPDVNAVIRRGRTIYERDSIDVFFQVAFEGGEDLSGAKIQNADRKSLLQIASELTDRAQRIRTHGDEQLTEKRAFITRLPSPLRGLALRAAEYLDYDMGLDLSRLGVPHDAFGSAMVTNVGMFGLPQGFAPLVPFSRVPIVLTLGAVEKRARVVADAIEIRPVLPIGATIDHRLLDGYQIGRIAQRFRAILEDPERELSAREAALRREEA